MPNDLHAFTVRVRPKLLEWLEGQAEKDHRSRTAQVVQLLEDAFTAAQSGPAGT